MNGKDDGLWFAVMANEDDDWSIGTEDIEEAKQMLLEQGQGLIAAINDMICMYKIYYEDIAPKPAYNKDDVEFEIYLLARSLQKLSKKCGRDIDLSTLNSGYDDEVKVTVNMFVDRDKLRDKVSRSKIYSFVRKYTRAENPELKFIKGICGEVEKLEETLLNAYK